MAPNTNTPGEGKGKQRRIRVIESNADDMTEMEEGHIIPGAYPPKNEFSRGGFGNRDGKEGFGSDTSDGPSATSVNEDADDLGLPADNMRTEEEGRGT